MHFYASPSPVSDVTGDPWGERCLRQIEALLWPLDLGWLKPGLSRSSRADHRRSASRTSGGRLGSRRQSSCITIDQAAAQVRATAVITR